MKHLGQMWLLKKARKVSNPSYEVTSNYSGLLGSSDIEILSDEEIFGLPAEAPTQNPDAGNPSPSSTGEIFDSDEEIFQPVGLKSSSPPSSENAQSCQLFCNSS